MKVGVIGAGTMGSGIAQAFAQTEGYEVCLCDINDEFAANGKNKIAKGFEKRIAKGKMEQAAADAILAKITTGTKEICVGPCNDRPGAVKLGNNQSITQEEAEAFEKLMKAGYNIEFALIKEAAIGNWKKFRGQFGFNG